MKKKERKQLPPVDTRDQQQMINLGLHPKVRETYNWSKTDEEKAKLKKLRSQYPYGRGFSDQSWGVHETKSIPVPGKLIVNVWGQPMRSYSCMQHDIPAILSKIKQQFTVKVINYKWNGTTYQSNELPFWQPRIKGGISIHLRG